MDGRSVAGLVSTVAVAAFVGGLLVGLQSGSSGGTTSAAPPVVTEPTTAPETTAPRQKRSRAEKLLLEYACWTGDDPTSQAVPTHAVVTLPGQRAELVDAWVGFAIWQDGAPGVLHGFCP
jgi:hypothetical protein